jgi:LCP family protein required for cell wall assembly
MILRRDEDGGVRSPACRATCGCRSPAPVERPHQRAYNEGPERLAATVTEALGIPIHHYVEVDFFGFKEIIDAVGGVDLCVEYVTRDTRSGLDLEPGCQTLDGTMALAFARSRYYEEFRDGQWRVDGSADLGRIRRQQLFMRAAINGAILEWRSSPFSSTADRLGDRVGAHRRRRSTRSGPPTRCAGPPRKTSSPTCSRCARHHR